MITVYSKTCLKQPLSKSPKIGFQDQLSLNAGQKYCRMLQWEHSAILSTFIKLPFSLRSLFCLFLSGRFTQAFTVCNFYSKFGYKYANSQLEGTTITALKM